MKISEVSTTNYYSCQFCNKNFKTTKEYLIKENSPLCSNLCLFRYIFKILKEYNEKDLDILSKEVNIIRKPLEPVHKLIYNITKYIVNNKILTINIEAQGSGSKIQAQIPEQKQAQAHTILYNRMVSLTAEPDLRERGVL